MHIMSVVYVYKVLDLKRHSTAAKITIHTKGLLRVDIRTRNYTWNRKSNTCISSKTLTKLTKFVEFLRKYPAFLRIFTNIESLGGFFELNVWIRFFCCRSRFLSGCHIRANLLYEFAISCAVCLFVHVQSLVEINTT